jgi:iron complex transport system ATP-binding protein
LTPVFDLRNVSMAYGEAKVLSGVSLTLETRSMVALVGPNGAGKSTLLGIMAGLWRGYHGHCLFEGTEVSRWNRRAFARRVAVVPQSLALEFPFTAEEVVLMGRTPFADGLFESEADHAAVARAMSLTDVTGFRARDFRSLSGGEKQRVVLAAALAQEPSVLLLDEPTTFLDLRHQLATYRLMRDLCREGLLVVAVTHDLNLAAAYGDRVIALKNGAVVADSTPAEAVTAGFVNDVFDVEAGVREGPGGRPWIVYGG